MFICERNTVEPPDFYAGRTTTDEAGFNWQGRHQSVWGMIMVLKGQLTVCSGNHHVPCQSGDLVINSPGLGRYLEMNPDSDIVWFHFIPFSGFIELIGDWPETAPGLKRLNYSGDYFRLSAEALLEAQKLDLWRPPKYTLLALSLLDSVLCRGTLILANKRHQTDNEWLAKAMHFIEEEQLGIDEIADRCNMSRASFYQKFRVATGMSPRKYREMGNLRRARYLLAATTIPLPEIARQCGFQDYSYFSNRFTAVYDQRPSVVRQQNKE